MNDHLSFDGSGDGDPRRPDDARPAAHGNDAPSATPAGTDGGAEHGQPTGDAPLRGEERAAVASPLAGDDGAPPSVNGSSPTADDRAAPSVSAPPSSSSSSEITESPATGDEAAREPGPPLSAAIEAILLVVDEPIDEVTLAQVLETPRDEIVATLEGLAQEYTDAGRGFELRSVAGGWRLYTRAECADVVERFVRDGQQARLTQAALETLAVVAYRQPVSRARVSAVRGVNCDGVMRTLTTRGLVEEAGVDTESGATLYRTTSYFLERLGMSSLDELPPLADYLPDADDVDEERTAQHG